MKKLLSIALCATAVSAFADPKEAVLGSVGVTAITTSLSNVIVAVSYDDLAGGEMVYSNLVKTTNLTVGDRLVEFRDNKYTGWVLAEGVGKVKYWQEQPSAFKDSAGKDITMISPAAGETTGAVGAGIWLVRQHPADGDVAVPFYIYGKPVSAAESKIPAGTWTLVGNPLQQHDVKIGTASDEGAFVAVVDTAQTGDQIVTVDNDGTLLYFGYVKNKGWGALPNIKPGIGFWILTKDATTIKWPKDKEESK